MRDEDYMSVPTVNDDLESSYMDDIFSDADNKNNLQEDEPQDNEDVRKKEKQEKKENHQKTNEKLEQKTNQDNDDEVSDPKQPTSILDFFNSADDDGNMVFDTNKAHKFVSAMGNNIEVDDPRNGSKSNIPQQLQLPQQQVESKEDALKNKFNTVQQNLLNGMDIMSDYINQGYSVKDAYTYAKYHINKQIEAMQLDSRFETMREETRREREELRKEREFLSLKPKSEKNMAQLARENGWPSTDQLQEVLLHPKFGGPFMISLFDLFDKSWRDDLKGADSKIIGEKMSDMYTRVTSNYQLASIAQLVAKTMLQSQAITQLVNNSRKKAVKQHEQQQKVNKTKIPVSRTNKPQSKSEKDDLDRYLGL